MWGIDLISKMRSKVALKGLCQSTKLSNRKLWAVNANEIESLTNLYSSKELQSNMSFSKGHRR